VVIAARTSVRSRRGRHPAESQRNDFRAPRKTERGLSQAAAFTHTRASWKGPWRPLTADTLRSGTLRAPPGGAPLKARNLFRPAQSSPQASILIPSPRAAALPCLHQHAQRRLPDIHHQECVLKMGGAGDSPAPVGDPPTGTALSHVAKRPLLACVQKQNPTFGRNSNTGPPGI